MLYNSVVSDIEFKFGILRRHHASLSVVSAMLRTDRSGSRSIPNMKCVSSKKNRSFTTNNSAKHFLSVVVSTSALSFRMRD